MSSAVVISSILGMAGDGERHGRFRGRSAEVDCIMAAEEWLTTDEAAAHLKVKPRSLLLWVRRGTVPAYALTGTRRRVWRFRKDDLDAALLSRPVNLPSGACASQSTGVGVQTGG